MALSLALLGAGIVSLLAAFHHSEGIPEDVDGGLSTEDLCRHYTHPGCMPHWVVQFLLHMKLMHNSLRGTVRKSMELSDKKWMSRREMAQRGRSLVPLSIMRGRLIVALE